MKRGEGKAGGIGNPDDKLANHMKSIEQEVVVQPTFGQESKSVGPTTQSRWSQRPAQPVL